MNVERPTSNFENLHLGFGGAAYRSNNDRRTWFISTVRPGALAPFEQYRKTGAYRGETRLASYEEQKAFFRDHGGVPDFSLPNPNENTTLSWTEGWSKIGPRKIAASSGGGPDGNLMHADIYLLNLIRSGIGGYYLLADNVIDSMCDAVQHATTTT